LSPDRSAAPEDSEPEIGADRLHGRGDDLYAALLQAHEGLSEADSQRLNARLVLLLANELDDPERAMAVFRAARRSLDGAA
jgi:hypothetical protein